MVFKVLFFLFLFFIKQQWNNSGKKVLQLYVDNYDI